MLWLMMFWVCGFNGGCEVKEIERYSTKEACEHAATFMRNQSPGTGMYTRIACVPNR
jgi:hypothetical protein